MAVQCAMAFTVSVGKPGSQEWFFSSSALSDMAIITALMLQAALSLRYAATLVFVLIHKAVCSLWAAYADRV